MFSRLFALSILALSVVVSASTLPVVDRTATTVAEPECRPACCNLIVKAHDDTLNGVGCYYGGIDCAFNLQLPTCCTLIIPGSTDARGCTVPS